MRSRSRLLLIASSVVTLVAIAGAALVWRATSGSGQSEPQTIDFDAPQVVPDAVAIVNGEPISGRLVDISVAGGTAPDDALQYAIDQELLIQAGERLGLTATTAEGVQWLKDVEASWENASPELREEIKAGLIAAGMPTSSLWNDPLVIENLGIPAATIVNIRSYIAEQEGFDATYLAQQAIDAFVEQERANATIVDCRTEDCSEFAAQGVE